MSFFDFPRFNFLGKITLDVATANNGFYLPLVIYDPIQVHAVSPPRIYLDEASFAPKVTKQDILAMLPPGTMVQKDESSRFAGKEYFEISPISDPKLFNQWAKTPLGQCGLDQPYWELYKKFIVGHTHQPLYNSIPGYWNYYGSMKLAYGWENTDGTIDKVSIRSVALSNGRKGENLYYEGDPKVPADLAPYLGATVTLNNLPEDQNTYTAVMTDLDPTFAIYTQIFNDAFTICRKKAGGRGHDIFLKGKPCKASLRFPNVFRVVNEFMPNSGSGNFFSAIDISDIPEGTNSPIIKLFQKYGDPHRALKGVFIHQNLLEVQENRPPDYLKYGETANPAKLTVSGSVSPWYEGEFRSIVMGRQLIGDQPFRKVKPTPEAEPVPQILAPQVIVNDPVNQVLGMQLLNSIPLFNTGGASTISRHSPPTQTNPVYITYSLGKVGLYLETLGPLGKVLSKKFITEYTFDEENLPREQFLGSGGVVRIPHNLSEEELQQGNLALYGQDNTGQSVRLMRENVYMINSDTAGLYTNEDEDPINGYLSYKYPKEPCIIRIYEKGQPVTQAIPITIQAKVVTDGGGDTANYVLRNTQHRDGDIVTFPTSGPANAMYLFSPGMQREPLPKGAFMGEAIGKGSFISVRVLPKHNYGKYLGTGPGTEKVTWDKLLDEVFNTIIMIYPRMNQGLALTARNWNNATMASHILNRISDEKWDSFHYMPPTRDLAADKKELIREWAKQFDLVPAESSGMLPIVLSQGDIAGLDPDIAEDIADRYIR